VEEEPESEQKPESDGDEEGGGGILGRTVGAILGVAPGREGGDEVDNGVPPGDRIDLNSATFEDLRELGFSVTQATRVITYRERQKGFKSVDDLAEVPGMPEDFLQDVKARLTL
jgi:competence ComEA-like helix-hairpin-helix protein